MTRFHRSFCAMCTTTDTRTCARDGEEGHGEPVRHVHTHGCRGSWSQGLLSACHNAKLAKHITVYNLKGGRWEWGGGM